MRAPPGMTRHCAGTSAMHDSTIALTRVLRTPSLVPPAPRPPSPAVAHWRQALPATARPAPDPARASRRGRRGAAAADHGARGHPVHVASAGDAELVCDLHRRDRSRTTGRPLRGLCHRPARPGPRRGPGADPAARARFQHGRVGHRARVGVVGQGPVRRHRPADSAVCLRDARRAPPGGAGGPAERPRQRRGGQARRGRRRRCCDARCAPPMASTHDQILWAWLDEEWRRDEAKRLAEELVWVH